MLLEKLRSQGIAEALEAIGYDCERIFGGLPRRRKSFMPLIPGEKFPAL